MSNPTQDQNPAAKRLALLQSLLAAEGARDPRAAGSARGGKVVRRAELASAPASFAQERLWFLCRLAPDSPVFHIPSGFRLRGALDADRLERSLAKVVEQHEALRARFVLEEGELRQRFDARAPSLERRSAKNLESAIGEARAAARLPFDLETGPLLRATLWGLAPDDHLLCINVHHIVAEVQSIAILMRGLLAAYGAGGTSPIAASELGFGDFATWQRAGAGEGEEAAGEKDLKYWREQLGGKLPTLELPTDRPRSVVQVFDGGTRSRAIAPESVAGLRRLAREEKTTLFTVYLAVLALFFQRYGKTDDVLIGAPMTDRNRAELEQVLGFFVQTLVLRVDLSGDPSFRELVRRAREVVLGAQSHQNLPFERLVKELQPERDLSKSPLFQVAFLLQTDAESNLGDGDTGGLAVESLDPLALHTDTSKFDLSFIVWDRGDELSLSFEYATTLFDGETIDRALAQLEVLGEGAGSHPDQPISGLELLPQAERELLLETWNRTEHAHPLDRCAHQLVEDAVDRAPDALAVTEGERTLTYGELEARSNQLAHLLIELGVSVEDRVALCTERNLELVIGALAVQKAGAAYVPVDLAYPAERIAYMVDDAKAKVVLTRSEHALALPDVAAQVIELDAEEGRLRALPTTRPAVQVGSENLAYVIYTSGSTGKPKGVELEHRGLVNLVSWHRRAYAVTAADRATHLAGLAFDASVWELWPYLAAGASLHLVPNEARMSPRNLVAWLAEKKITQSFLPTPLCEVLLAEELPADFALRVVLTGGDKLHRPPRPGLPFVLINHYGPTENTVVATCAQVSPVPAEEAAFAPAPSIGGPIDNVQVFVLDEGGRPAPIGVPGELFVGGASLARGYRGRPDLTADKFVMRAVAGRDPERLYATGDLVRWKRDGGIEFLGRIDAQVKVRGFRIELGEVETVLAAHPDVRECAVSLAEDSSGASMLVGHVVPVDLVSPPPHKELRAHLGARLPDYMVPAVFAELKALPLTPNGKLDRRALPTPEFQSVQTAGAFVSPEGELEETIAGAWREVLGLERVGSNANFFDIGGQSLLMARVHALLQERVDSKLSIIELFHYPTVNSLAGHISERVPAKDSLREGRDRAANRRARMKDRARRRS